ncbi:hypothetical protein ABT120_36180 [Nonomuraea angiospora]|uniref:hypothetical protein n=1 Tax=Nonomuraea angiospora TaxID=46172 RepID=UPI003323E18D
MLSPSRDRSIDRSTAGRPIVSQAVVIADEHREVLGLTVGEQAFWTEFLRSLHSRHPWKR